MFDRMQGLVPLGTTILAVGTSVQGHFEQYLILRKGSGTARNDYLLAVGTSVQGHFEQYLILRKGSGTARNGHLVAVGTSVQGHFEQCLIVCRVWYL
jgi:hypothetical protein